MKVLITGSEGFIGSHLTERLVKKGHSVKAFVMYNFKNSNGWLDSLDKDILKNIKICKGDIRDYSVLERESKNCDAIIHLAALIGIPYSYYSPKSYVDTNISGTLNILQAARKNNITRIIHTSTSEVYGSAKIVPMKETHPLNGQSPYSASKIAADQIALSFYSSFNLPLITLRPFNTFGPRQSERAIIPTIINQIINSKDKFLKLGNLSPTRDFNYVEDICSGYELALKANNIFGETINLGSGYETSIKEIAILISSLMQRDVKFTKISERIRPKKSEVDRLCASNKKAKKLLKWKPKFVGKKGLKEALIKTIDWYEKNSNTKEFGNKSYVI